MLKITMERKMMMMKMMISHVAMEDMCLIQSLPLLNDRTNLTITLVNIFNPLNHAHIQQKVVLATDFPTQWVAPTTRETSATPS